MLFYQFGEVVEPTCYEMCQYDVDGKLSIVRLGEGGAGELGAQPYSRTNGQGKKGEAE